MNITGNAGNCTREPLARGGGCGIELCSCGTIHVNIGPVTLRILPSVMEDFAATFDTALRAYRRHVNSDVGGEFGIFGSRKTSTCSS